MVAISGGRLYQVPMFVNPDDLLVPGIDILRSQILLATHDDHGSLPRLCWVKDGKVPWPRVFFAGAARDTMVVYWMLFMSDSWLIDVVEHATSCELHILDVKKPRPTQES